MAAGEAIVSEPTSQAAKPSVEAVPTPCITRLMRWSFWTWLDRRLLGPFPPLSSASDLVAKLQKAPPEVVDQVYELSKRVVDDERGRQARLDAKANSLLAVIGLSLTVAFTFGGTLVKDAASYPTGGAHIVAAIAFAGALVCGTVSAFLAVAAMRIRGNVPGMNEDAVFNETLFEAQRKNAEEKAKNSEDQAKNVAEKAKNAEGTAAENVTSYKLSLAVHLWMMGSKNREVQSRKATVVGHGQSWFGGFLACLLVVFGSLVYAAVVTDGKHPAQPPTGQGSSRPS